MDPLTIAFMAWAFLNAKKSSESKAVSYPSPGRTPVHVPAKPRPVPARPAAAKPSPVSDVSFPGPAWEADVPPAQAVQARALALIPVLWARGEGAAVVEDMNLALGLTEKQARPTGFLARAHGDKKAVEAFRLKAGTVLKETSKPAAAPPVEDLEDHPSKKYTDKPYAPPAPAPAGNNNALGLPTLREGSRGPDVILAQQRLGGIVADGIFGSKTTARTVAYQRENGLKVDGIIGPETWGSLFSGGAG